MRPQKPPGSEGFVLIAALAAVVIGAAWSAQMAQRMTASFTSATTIATETKARQNAQDAVAAAIYLATTAPRDACGWRPAAAFVELEFTAPPMEQDIPCLALRGDPVRLEGGEAQLQDWNGLPSVRLVNQSFVTKLAISLAPSAPPLQYGPLLQDFGDINDELSPDGAEAYEYTERGLPAPRNRWPRVPGEAFDALGWNNLTSTPLRDVLGISRIAALNVNAAPEAVLASAPGLDRALAAKIVEARNKTAISGSGDLGVLTDGATTDFPFFYSFLASDHLRVRAGAPGAAPVMETSIRVGSGVEPPLWTIDYAILLPKAATNDGPKQDSALPPPDPLRDQQWLLSRE